MKTGTLSILLLLISISYARAEQPNIVFIMIDDLGWMDLACQGNKLVDTPHVDRFAKQGMTFTNAYAAAPVCSPTRAAIMTGNPLPGYELRTILPIKSGSSPTMPNYCQPQCTINWIPAM